ncbi:MAG TPA: ferrous iron transport protein B, partial [Phycisphaerae bacterium]|nr:ferrous iron transport protein B [Phycisphaerae bacterium]
MTAATQRRETGLQIRQVAVAGNPNSGKTTLFNRLTGLRQRVANYPGVTVEKREGRLSGTDIVLLDLPGTYSLCARSPDEVIARDVLLGRQPGTARPDAILLVIDASNLERNLYLASQIIEFGTPVVIACNMIDVAEARGLHVNCKALSRELGVPVVAASGKTGRGLDEIRAALGALRPREPFIRPWSLAPEFEKHAARVQRTIERSGVIPSHAARAGALLWLTDYLSEDRAGVEPATRFLSRLGSEDAASLRESADAIREFVHDPAASAIEARYAWISQVAARVARPAMIGNAKTPGRSWTDRLDAILTHRIYGVAIFAALMFALFLAIFSGAEPLMGIIESGQLAVADAIRGAMAEGPLQSLLADGVVGGVGSVIVFFPQICMMFLFLAVLEDSGYMARAAFLMDRVMSRVGLHGRSFIPLLSSYACAIPGIMATRT